MEPGVPWCVWCSPQLHPVQENCPRISSSLQSRGHSSHPCHLLPSHTQGNPAKPHILQSSKTYSSSPTPRETRNDTCFLRNSDHRVTKDLERFLSKAFRTVMISNTTGVASAEMSDRPVRNLQLLLASRNFIIVVIGVGWPFFFFRKHLSVFFNSCHGELASQKLPGEKLLQRLMSSRQTDTHTRTHTHRLQENKKAL